MGLIGFIELLGFIGLRILEFRIIGFRALGFWVSRVRSKPGPLSCCHVNPSSNTQLIGL